MKSKDLSVPVIVAVIGLCGVLGAAIINNWKEIFPSETPEATEEIVTLPPEDPTEPPKTSVYELNYNTSYASLAGGLIEDKGTPKYPVLQDI